MTSTAPTQPPDKCPATLELEPPNAPDTCPACGARKIIDSGEFVHYVCGVCYWRAGQKVVSDLYDDHAAVITLRANLVAALARAEKAAQETKDLRFQRDARHRQVQLLESELDAALARAEKAELSRDQLSDGLHVVTIQRNALTARVAELQAVGRNLIQAGLEYTDDLGKWCIGCGEIFEWAGDHYAINHKPDCPVMALTAALASGAESEVTR